MTHNHKMPLVTIGITTFDAQESIECAIKSALAQTWKPIEIVIVDDASTDTTYDFLLRLAAKNPEIRIFQNEKNGGVAVTRNRILKEATGEYIAFFDDDDVSLPERVALQVERIERYKRQFKPTGPIICHTARAVSYPNGHEQIQDTMGGDQELLAPNGTAVVEQILLGKPLNNGNGACPACSQMGERICYDITGGFDPDLRRGEDTDLNIRLAAKGGHFVGISTPLVKQNMTKGSDKNFDIELCHNLNMIQKYAGNVLSKRQAKFCVSWFHLKHFWFKKKLFKFGFSFLKLILQFPIMTLRRTRYAAKNIHINNAFKNFHKTEF